MTNVDPLTAFCRPHIRLSMMDEKGHRCGVLKLAKRLRDEMERWHYCSTLESPHHYNIPLLHSFIPSHHRSIASHHLSVTPSHHLSVTPSHRAIVPSYSTTFPSHRAMVPSLHHFIAPSHRIHRSDDHLKLRITILSHGFMMLVPYAMTADRQLRQIYNGCDYIHIIFTVVQYIGGSRRRGICHSTT